MQMEMLIQHERQVPVWNNMYQLIIDSTAASLYVQSFLERKKTKIFEKDFCDGTMKVEQQPDNRETRKVQSTAVARGGGALKGVP